MNDKSLNVVILMYFFKKLSDHLIFCSIVGSAAKRGYSK